MSKKTFQRGILEAKQILKKSKSEHDRHTQVIINMLGVSLYVAKVMLTFMAGVVIGLIIGLIL